MREIGWPRIITCLNSKKVEISRLAILVVLHYLNENVPEFLSNVAESKQIFGLLKENLSSNDQLKVVYTIKCYCVIAMSKEWACKSIAMEVIPKMMAFIFESSANEEAQEVQEEAINFVRNLIFKFKNFGAKDSEKDEEESWLKSQNILINEYGFSEKLQELLTKDEGLTRSSYKACKEIAKQMK